MNGSMAVLREILDVAQDDPSSQRRWFHDDYFDLFVLQAAGELAAFQLCYGIDSNERALVWSRDGGFFHDGGPSGSGEFIGAGIAPGDSLEADPIIARFEQAAGGLPEALRLALNARLREYALQDADGAARRARFRRAAWQRAGGESSSKQGRGRNP
ncbi:MAG: hypothetical protein WBO23_04495 [Burkholderiales bacterium]